MQTALTDQRYWDDVWGLVEGEDAPRLTAGSVQRHLDRVLGERLGPGRRFLEIGAAGSPWLERAARLGAEVWGIDLSRAGLELVAKSGAKVHLVEGDLFDPGKLPAAAFDVVYSGGFLEHFVDASPVTHRMAELLAPFGVVVTTVPNLSGLNGWLQRHLDREVFDRHVLYTPAELDAAHAAGGLLAVEPARYIGVIDLGMVNFAKVAAELPRYVLAALWRAIALTRRSSEWIAEHAGKHDGGQLLAPMIAGVYRRG